MKLASTDKTLFIKRSNNELLLVQIYVDDIVFGATNEALCKEFSSSMQEEFEIYMMKELIEFLPCTSSYTNEAWNLPMPNKVLCRTD